LYFATVDVNPLTQSTQHNTKSFCISLYTQSPDNPTVDDVDTHAIDSHRVLSE